MEPFNTPLKIMEISLPHRAVFGPMAGFTDAPARRLMAQHGAGFTLSEMVSSPARYAPAALWVKSNSCVI